MLTRVYTLSETIWIWIGLALQISVFGFKSKVGVAYTGRASNILFLFSYISDIKIKGEYILN